MDYLSIFNNTTFEFITSLKIGEFGADMDELKQKAAVSFPGCLTLEQTEEDYQRTVAEGLIYDGESLKEPTPPTAAEIADKEAAQEAYIAVEGLKSVAVKAMMLQLAGNDLSTEQAEYQTSLMSVSDGAALKMQEYFPAWDGNGKEYKTGDRVLYNGVLYKVLQNHTSQAGWTPTDAPSLFAKVLTSTDGTILDWEQPGSTNPYMAGDKVRYNGRIYESTIDNNVWAPDAYPQGWKDVTDEYSET